MPRITRAAVRRRNSARAARASPAPSSSLSDLCLGRHRKISFVIDIQKRRIDNQHHPVGLGEGQTSQASSPAGVGPGVAARRYAAGHSSQGPTSSDLSGHNLSSLEPSDPKLSDNNLSGYNQPDDGVLSDVEPSDHNISDSDVLGLESSDPEPSDPEPSDCNLSDGDLSDPAPVARPGQRGFEARYPKWFREARRMSCSGARALQYSEKISYQWVKGDGPGDLEGMKAAVMDEVKKLCICYSDILMLGTVIKAALPAVSTDSETFGKLFIYGKAGFYKLRLRTLWKNAYVSTTPCGLCANHTDSRPEKLAYSWLRDPDPSYQPYQGICIGPEDHAALSAADQQWLEGRFDSRSFHAVFGWCQRVLDDSAVRPDSPSPGVRSYLRRTFSTVMVMVGRVVAIEMRLNAGSTWECYITPPGKTEWARAVKERRVVGTKFYSLGVTGDGGGPEWQDFPWRSAQNSQQPSLGEGRRRGSREAQQRARDFVKNPDFARRTNVLYFSPLAAPGGMPPRRPSAAECERAWISLNRTGHPDMQIPGTGCFPIEPQLDKETEVTG